MMQLQGSALQQQWTARPACCRQLQVCRPAAPRTLVVVVAASARRQRNPLREVQQRWNLLPDGKPNTPWRRVKLRIQTAVSLQVLIRIYNSNRHKTAVWRPIHAAGILMRAAALLYYRLLLEQRPADQQTSALALELLDLLAPDLADSAVTRVMAGDRLAQLVVVLSWLQPQPPARLLDPLVRELTRHKGNKLPADTPDLLAELAAALARLGWREQQLWLAVAAAATESLQTQAQARITQQQKQQQQQQQRPQWLSADYTKLAAALTAVGFEDTTLLHLLGSEAAAAAVLPLLSLQELAALAQAYAAFALPHPDLLPALWRQLPLTAQRCALHATSSRRGSSRQQALQAAVGIAGALHALLQLSEGAVGGAQQATRQQRRMAQQQHDLMLVVQDLVIQSGSSSSSSGGSSSNKSSSTRNNNGGVAAAGHHNHQGGAAAVLPPSALVQLLELVAQAAATQRKWRQSPLARWLLTAVAAAGLDSSMSPQQLQAAAAAVAELQPAPASRAVADSSAPAAAARTATASATAALAAAAVARAEECGAGVLASVLWACVTAGHADVLLAEVTVSVVLEAAAAPSEAFLSAQQQAQLVWSLQQMCRADLAQQVLAACWRPPPAGSRLSAS